MSKCGWRLLIGLIVALIYPAVRAADLLEAYRDAAAGDPRLRAAAATRQAAQEVPVQARAALLPRLDITLNRGRTFDYDSDIPGREAAFDTHNYSLALNQPLYDRAARVGIRRAGPVARRADADYAAARQDLLLRVAERYFNVLRERADLTFQLADERAIARQLEQARQRFEVGLLAITDVYEAQARYDLVLANEVAVRNRLADSLEALQEVTGEGYSRIQELDARMPLEPVEPADAEVWVAMALESNPQLIGAAFGVEIARADIDLQSAGHYPTLSLTAGYFDSDSGRVESSGNRIGLQLVIPLYQGGAVSARTRQAAYRYEATKENLDQFQRQVARRVREAYQSVETARRRVQALTQAVVSTRSALEATRAGFEVGTRTIVDVLNAERNFLEAERNLIVSRYDYLINRLRLSQAAGRIEVEHLTAINGWLRVSEPVEPAEPVTEMNRAAPRLPARLLSPAPGLPPP